MSAPPVAWVTVPTVDLARHVRGRELHWPFPFDSAHVGRWEPSLEELLARGPDPLPTVETQPVSLLLDNILRAPAYCAFVIRAEAGHETLHAAIGAAGDVVVLVDTADTARLARVGDTQIAATLAAQLPGLRAAAVPGAHLSARTADALEAAITADVPAEQQLAMFADAGVPDTWATRLLPGAAPVVATGTVGAVRYAADGMWVSACSASWTEFADGAVISTRERTGDVRWDPMSTNALGHAVADALTGLAS